MTDFDPKALSPGNSGLDDRAAALEPGRERRGDRGVTLLLWWLLLFGVWTLGRPTK